VVIHKNGMLEMTIINVIFLTNVEKCFRVLVTQLLPLADLHQNCHAWLRRGRHRHAQFCSDRFNNFCSPNTWLWLALFLRSFFGRLLQLATAQTTEHIFTQNTS